jgi:hypothetical protein
MPDESAAGACFLAELYAPRHDPDRLLADTTRIRAATEELARSGEPIRYLDCLLLPDEGTTLHLFEAQRPEAVERTLHAAGLDVERISPAIELGAGSPLLDSSGLRRRVCWPGAVQGRLHGPGSEGSQQGRAPALGESHRIISPPP